MRLNDDTRFEMAFLVGVFLVTTSSLADSEHINLGHTDIETGLTTEHVSKEHVGNWWLRTQDVQARDVQTYWLEPPVSTKQEVA